LFGGKILITFIARKLTRGRSNDDKAMTMSTIRAWMARFWSWELRWQRDSI